MVQSTSTNMIILTIVSNMNITCIVESQLRLGFLEDVLRDLVLDNTRSISYIPSSTTQGYCFFFLLIIFAN
jgi:hypothetical protein